MKECWECSGMMKEMEGTDPNGVPHHYYKCNKCGEEILDMEQLHEAAEKYRKMKKYRSKLSRWGLSLGFRIPKELVKKYKFKKEVSIIPEEGGIRVIPA